MSARAWKPQVSAGVAWRRPCPTTGRLATASAFFGRCCIAYLGWPFGAHAMRFLGLLTNLLQQVFPRGVVGRAELFPPFGQGFIDYYCRIKEAEIARFNLEVTEWEHREYFELY